MFLTLHSTVREMHTESRLITLLWLALAVCIGYENILDSPFQFDDFNIIVNEVHVHSMTSWFANIGSGIRPLLKFSYTLNWVLGTGVIGFHLTNLLIHLANAYLVYRLAQEFIQQQWLRNNLIQVPILTALLFAVHPVQTEAVSYICGRSSSLMTLFYLAALLCYVSGRIRGNGLYSYVATPFLFILALAVKETAITLPLALLLWELGCGGRWKAAFKPQWPTWLVSGLAILIFIFSDSYFAQMQRSAEFNSLIGNLNTQISGFTWLMRQWVLPLWLNIDPDLQLQNKSTSALLPMFLFSALFALMLVCWHKRPWLSFALAWAMLQLVPLYLFLPRLDIANERQLYLAGWPLFLALSIEITLWLNSVTFRLVAAALLLTFASLTILRNRVYSSEISLWQDTVLKSPHKARVHNNLGYAFLLAQKYDEARNEFTAALKIDPLLTQARNNLIRTDDEIEKTGGRFQP